MKKKSAIVIGGSKGIGAGIAKTLIKSRTQLKVFHQNNLILLIILA